MFGLDIVTCDPGQAGSVQCGTVDNVIMYKAESCEKCVDLLSNEFMKKYLGYTLCNGDCEWDVTEEMCRDKGTFQAIYPIQGGYIVIFNLLLQSYY